MLTLLTGYAEGSAKESPRHSPALHVGQIGFGFLGGCRNGNTGRKKADEELIHGCNVGGVPNRTSEWMTDFHLLVESW